MEHDKLMAMTDEERLAWLEEEAEALITSAPDNLVLRLRYTHARMKKIRHTWRNQPLISTAIICEEMVRNLRKLNRLYRRL